ncbi:MAG: phosphoglucomutase/phosphomannomutase family protein [Candidatus Omnitrophica bacterium]|nr:phosphoglucomutase/phosphomannomutase family protein [Candidatus Omnitrophota bacterium]
MGDSGRIHFGTSGWRAIIADEFTFENVRLVTQAIARTVKTGRRIPGLIVGYDTRFLSEQFARCCAGVLAAANIKVLLTNRDTPTPVIAFHIINKQLSGGINFTASHNPPEYNGIKFSPAYGGPAPQEVTSEIERNIAVLRAAAWQPGAVKDADSLITTFDPRQEYLKRMRSLVDLKTIKKAKMKIAVDCLYGTSRGYIDSLLEGQCRTLTMFNDYPNPLFGGFPPEPDVHYIPKMITHVRRNAFHLGLACDGDADRFGIVDRGGFFLTPNEVFTLLFYYLLRHRGKAAKVARTLATTHMIDAIARAEGVEVIETPVGFKYIGEALHQGDCLIGGEESGGLSIQGHVPEKDGILACLLIAEMVAREKKSLRDILNSLYKRYGYFYSGRINVRVTPEEKEALLERLKKLVRQETFAGIAITKKNFTDGYKLIFAENCWVMFRPSGTEPVVRCYFEADSKRKLAHLHKQVVAFIRG